MAASLNLVQFIGNLTRPPESRQTPNGVDVTSFSIAVNEKYKDQERTEFIDCVAWSKLSQIISQYCGQGDCVYIAGRWTTDRYKDKDGNDRKAVKVTVEKLQMLGSKGGKGEGGNKGQGGGGPQNAQGYDDIPDFDSSEVPF